MDIFKDFSGILNISYIRGIMGFNIFKNLILLSFFSFVLLTPSFSLSASVLYVDPSEGVISPNQMFAVDVRIDNQEQCLNVFDVGLNYSKDKVKVVTVSRGKSILTLWVEDPVVDHEKGEIMFTGGIPGGYCGRVIGDPDLTNILVTVVFQPLNEDVFSGEVEVSFNEKSSVLLSDGQGSLSPLNFLNAVFEVGDEPTVFAEEWLEIVRNDDRAPVSFDIELLKEESVFDGNYYIVFSTTDKGSGLSHYEVKEEDVDHSGFIRGSDKEARFEKVQSPYLLKDQTLNSKITVKAVDNAGNERLARYEPEESMRQSDNIAGLKLIQSAISWMILPQSWFSLVFSIFLLLILLYVFLLLNNRRKRRNLKIDEDNDLYTKDQNINNV